MKVQNNEANLRKLLTDIYVAVLARIPAPLCADDIPPVPEEAWDALATTVLDAAEGRHFEPLRLPWPK